MDPWPQHHLFSFLFCKSWWLRDSCTVQVGSTPTLFQFLFPDLGWSISSLPNQRKFSLGGFRIRVGVPTRALWCGQGTRRIDWVSGWEVGSPQARK